MRSGGKNNRPVTINDVAAAAGVSRQTVTRAMNNMAGINEATKARVLAAARELKYRPSRFGRGLVKHTHRTLGLVVHDLTNPYYPELASALVGFAAERGWNVVLADTVHAEDRAAVIADLTRQVDAIVGYLQVPADRLDDIVAEMPAVELDSDPASTRAGIELAYHDAAQDAVDHLIERGTTHPVMLDSPTDGGVSQRAEVFTAAFGRRHLPMPVVHADDVSVDGAAHAIDELLADSPTTDAIVAFNDILAVGALNRLRHHGIAVPDDVRVVGIDGLSIGTFVTPRLTTLARDMPAVARLAVETAIGIYDGDLPPTGDQVRHRVGHRLLVRDST